MPDPLRMLLLLGGSAVLFAVIVALGFGLVWYSWDRPQEVARQRRAKGLCPRCGYNLVRNPSRVCPECGHPKLKLSTQPTRSRKITAPLLET